MSGEDRVYEDVVQQVSEQYLGKPFHEVWAALDSEFSLAEVVVDDDNLHAVADNISKGIEQPG